MPHISYQYCLDLAWSGLQGSVAFDRLHPDDQARINGAIRAEKDPTGSKGLKETDDPNPKGNNCEN